MAKLNQKKRNLAAKNKADVFCIETASAECAEQTLARLQSDARGLTAQEACARLKTCGPNEVAHDNAPPALVQLLQAFNNPFIYVLMALALISFVTDYAYPLRAGQETDLTGVTIIVTMVLLSGLLRFWQEFRTNKAAQALKAMVRTTATVLRRPGLDEESEKQVIAVEALVPGDIVLLSAGDRVPADLRLLASRDLFISQAMLSGESLPVEKYDITADEQRPAADVNLPDRSNICLMGTSVASGTARGVVVATGPQTWLGSLARSLEGCPQTAFDKGVNSVSRLLIRFMLVMVPVVLLINGFTKGDWTDATFFALAVAVGLTPEMLPMIVSSNLAKGAIVMARRKVIVKRINAIQNVGAMDVLCTDKTGTLTEDTIALEGYLDAEGRESLAVLSLAWLNSASLSGTTNPMDRAVLACGQEKLPAAGRADAFNIDELPFDFARRRVSVVVERYGERQQTLICKGAVEEMLSVSTHIRKGDAVYALDEARRDAFVRLTRDYHTRGLRVLVVATRVLPEAGLRQPLSEADENGLIIEGVLTFLDPPKESAAHAIAALQEHGVTVKVLTGDHPLVAARICEQVGIDNRVVLTGNEIAAMDDARLADAVQTCAIFATLTPLQKSRILQALQRNGHTVGFLGDGINDAPALHDADVGISVDSAADIAKESSDIILLEKDLRVLGEGVITGRETFGNILKYLNMTASSNFGNVFSVLVASAFLPFLPMLAIHLLVQNLMYDISQLSLPWDRMDNAFLRQPRKWDAPNIRRFMLWIGPTSSLFDIATFAVMWFVFAANTPAMQALFQSGWFVEGLLSQTLVVHMLRTRKIPFIQSRAALPVLVTTFIVMAVGVAIPFSPLGHWIGLVPLPLAYFPWLAGILFAYCVVAQLMKRFYIRRFGQWF
ncbi:magnesium-translocating P-type ATPase [Cronobacter dublinensis]|uniref:magnesium-translocating P-type ATPase n=1 Tax=Cronobacter dublinensis TaxID=413497 RepID=UPI000CFD0F61|nr:magnesium-translocating P-type ATPase [Cronobacter dublinensis]EKY3089482.1 magnesium-translocating P-type ATPase [Cronobacter dublinensis]ELQ6230279.1 magnesium-translocating P-type ATPase [Cronobacter dublinensis]ELY4007592.1 magnesium-translocating P-type ATPase [Cronobacter dublinensis]ELY4408857.1 magnesium-translocating P-type ATPase [Cronobacter dublinensis]ELY5820841.1 magnesium-translocating P-type ATPase [Cronobacter dublinensis]